MCNCKKSCACELEAIKSQMCFSISTVAAPAKINYALCGCLCDV